MSGTGRAWRLAALLAGCNLAAIGVAVSAPPIEEFTRADEFGSVQISPDGNYLAMVTGQVGDSRLLFFNLPEKRFEVAVAATGSQEISGYQWVSAQRVVYFPGWRYTGNKFAIWTGDFVGINRDGKRHGLIYGPRGDDSVHQGHTRRRQASLATGSVLSRLPGDDRFILISEQPWRQFGRFWHENPDAMPRIARLDVFSGDKRNLGTVPLASARVLLDSEHEPRFAFGLGEANVLTAIWKPERRADWQRFEVEGFRPDTVIPHAFTHNEGAVQFSGVREGESLSALYEMDLEDHRVTRLFGHEVVDIDRVIFAYQGGPVIGVRLQHGRQQYHWLEPGHPVARTHQALERAFPGQSVVLTSMTQDRRRGVAVVYSDVNPGDFYVVDLESMAASLTVRARRWVQPGRMRPMTPIELPARDGLVLHGYLTRPEGEGPYPMVVVPHGGPHGVRDRWGYDPETQLLASRGYAVLQVNFRGSGGYGVDFEQAGYGEWGGKMQDDIADATRWAVAEGIADAERVCIYGASFGGYSALMGAVREPDLYRCAIAFAGVYDLELMFTTGDVRLSRAGRDYLDKVLGDDRSVLREASPVYHAERIKAPVLMVHGSEDWRADASHARRMKTALENAGKAHEWIELRGEGHGIFDDDTRRAYYEQLLAFLARHIGRE